MRRIPVITGGAMLLGMMVVSLQAADETPVKSRVVSAGLFKNGLAVIERAVTVPGPGLYRIDDVLEPVHGTLAISGESLLETRVTQRTIEVPIERQTATDLQESLAGKSVTIYFRDGGIPVATGIVEELPVVTGEEARLRQDELQLRNFNWYAQPREATSRFLILKTKTGRSYLDPTMIAYVQSEETGAQPMRRTAAQVVLFQVGETAKSPTTITLKYLAKGLSWAPGYRLDISARDQLSLEQTAVVKNEFGKIEDAELFLISGFPSVKFAHVTSPLAARASWAEFFQQLNQHVGSSHSLLMNSVSQQGFGGGGGNTSAADLDLGGTPNGEGVDLYYHSIGKRTLADGDALTLKVASGQTAYERLVEWIVPDTRNEWGHPIDEHRRDQDPDRYQDAAWDSLKYRNPLKFPMTTGPAMIATRDRFLGQQLSQWVNSGEETVLHITKALSLRTKAVEHEVPGNDDNSNRQLIRIGGRDFRRVPVKGELTMNNHRREPIRLLVRRNFSGELVKADGEPTTLLLEDGVYSVNPRRQMTWTLQLAPGEERILTYNYTVLVSH